MRCSSKNDYFRSGSNWRISSVRNHRNTCHQRQFETVISFSSETLTVFISPLGYVFLLQMQIVIRKNVFKFLKGITHKISIFLS